MRNILLGVLVVVLVITSGSTAMGKNMPYQIGPGDVIEISVWKDPELSRTVVVPPDGVIGFPLIDAVKVSGMTILQLKALIAKKLSVYVPDVTVTVLLTEINSMQAYVIGKVNDPGQYQIGLDTNVMQVLAMAKGLTPFASKGKIMILRQEKGKLIKMPFDYSEVEKGKKLEQNVILRSGDVVVVP